MSPFLFKCKFMLANLLIYSYLLKFDVRQIVFKLKLVNTPRSFLLLKKEKVPTLMTCIFQLA